MSNKLEFDKKLLGSLYEIEDFLEHYIDNLDPVEEVDGEPTDYKILGGAIKDLRKVIKSKPCKREVVEKIKVVEREGEWENEKYVCIEKQNLKNLIFTKEKFARESIKPLFRYCVVDVNFNEMGVTDDIGDAMIWGARASRVGHRYNVCRVVERSDKTWVLMIEGYCEDGGYDDAMDKNWEYLHYDFVRQKVGNSVVKIGKM